MPLDAVNSIVGSLAGLPLAQTAGADIARAQQAAASQRNHAARQSTAADQIARAEDHQLLDRDADGRRMWVVSERPPAVDKTHGDATDSPPPGSDVGQRLDVSG